jgi:hypothetical protein
MTNKHKFAIAALVGVGIGFFILSGQNTYGAGVWGNKVFGPFYGVGNQVGTNI